MDINTVMKEIKNRLKEKHISNRDLAELFGMSEKGVWAWFSGQVCIPIDKLVKLAEIADAELIIRDKNTHEIISGNLSESDLRDIEEHEQLHRVKQALSVLSNFLKET